MKFLTVIKEKVKVSAVKVKEGDGRMGQFENDKICDGVKGKIIDQSKAEFDLIINFIRAEGLIPRRLCRNKGY